MPGIYITLKCIMVRDQEQREAVGTGNEAFYGGGTCHVTFPRDTRVSRGLGHVVWVT